MRRCAKVFVLRYSETGHVLCFSPLPDCGQVLNLERVPSLSVRPWAVVALLQFTLDYLIICVGRLTCDARSARYFN